MEIFYFSGTGNSLHVAREIASRFSDARLVPILPRLRGEGLIESTDEVVGIIFPIHAFTFPWPVKQFLERFNPVSAKYIFAIATRECFVKTFLDMDKILAKRGRTLDAYFSFEMPETYLPLFQMYSEEKCQRVEANMLKEVERIFRIVSSGEPHRPKDAKGWFVFSHIIYPMVTWVFQRIQFPKMENLFYAEEGCTQCGTCEKVCLAGKISMGDKSPKWDKSTKCVYCFSCIHYCPAEVIQLKGKKTVGKGRYHHPTVNAKEISEQKQ